MKPRFKNYTNKYYSLSISLEKYLRNGIKNLFCILTTLTNFQKD